MNKFFTTLLLDEAFNFIEKQDLKARNKILQNIRRAEKDRSSDFFKKLNDTIWEFRTLYLGKQYRLLAFWDKENNSDTLVIATHGFVKKKSRVDNREIERAESIRKLYLKQKNT